MKAFSQLYQQVDETTKTNVKLAALVKYLSRTPPEDAIWAVTFLMGRKPRQVVPARKLKEWAAERADIPLWLFEASYDTVGDLAETITLLLPKPTVSSEHPLHVWVEERLLPLRDKDMETQRQEILSAWRQMDTTQRFVWNKLITGGFRVGISQKLVTRALARFSGLDDAVIAHRLMGDWEPSSRVYHQIISSETGDTHISKPYPFFLAYPLDQDVNELGAPSDWQAEWKWDGIRAQLVKRNGRVFLWSRGEELVSDKFPEIAHAAAALPDGTVMDGEILPWADGHPLDFSKLQRRIGRKNLTSRILEAVPVILMVYDLMEFDREDVRETDLAWRYSTLSALVSKNPDARIMLSQRLENSSWESLAKGREQARSLGVEGLMLKRLASPYGVGRKRGVWWKWKVDPFAVDAVLIYAQTGHGRRSGLYTDYTFALRQGEALVPFAKAYSGLTDQEIRRVDRFIKQNTLEKFGPVRSVKPELVFEIAFDGIHASNRHKSGVAVRFPRIARWRTDKTAQDADTVDQLRALL